MSKPPAGQNFVLLLPAFIIFTFLGCLSVITTASADSDTFTNPVAVSIYGLPVGSESTPIGTEEPFISRDGRFLFFNSSESEGNKDLHYAQRINDRWEYQRELGPRVNTKKEVEGAPTMDAEQKFYFVDTGTKRMISGGIFEPGQGRLTGVAELVEAPDREVRLLSQEFEGNMDVEVSADGVELYLSRAVWRLLVIKPIIVKRSDLLLMTKKNGRFEYDKVASDRILKHINTGDLEYAASLSVDGLELFFTRLASADLKAKILRSKIMYARRASKCEPFGKPKMIAAIGSADFVEGPSISADGKVLYYHKREGTKFRTYSVAR